MNGFIVREIYEHMYVYLHMYKQSRMTYTYTHRNLIYIYVEYTQPTSKQCQATALTSSHVIIGSRQRVMPASTLVMLVRKSQNSGPQKFLWTRVSIEHQSLLAASQDVVPDPEPCPSPYNTPEYLDSSILFSKKSRAILKNVSEVTKLSLPA